ncbi:fungal hydrophobin-domain-containing protein [Infundibulicybe gibba]|nr:fungal hydrophobin-domain-containing protein [Infundibulicybe gibba]
MQFKAPIVAAIAFATLAAAIPTDHTDPPPPQCSTGPVQCCNSIQDAADLSDPVKLLLGLLGVVVGDITGLVGIACSPLSVVGVGGNSCSTQPVCCTENSFSGLVALGCSPININL